MVKNICSRFGIEPSDGVTKLAYIESGNVYILASDEQLTTFLQSVAGLDPPATLYVYDDVTTGNDASSEENREDNSNIGDQHDLEAVERKSTKKAKKREKCTISIQWLLSDREIQDLAPPSSTKMKTRVLPKCLAPRSSRLAIAKQALDASFKYQPPPSVVICMNRYTSTSYVPETQQAPEEADTKEEDEDEDEDEVRDIDPDNYVYQIPDDFHDLPPHPRSDDVVITPNQAIRYSRREKVKLHQVFRTKGDLTLALGLKFLQEGFEFRTPKSCKKRYEAICAQKNCGWRIYASCLGGSTMFQVQTLNDVHTCSRTQMHSAHRNTSRRVLSHLLLDKTGDVRRDLRAADIIKDMKAQHKINVSYWQAWRAKWQAINMIEGDPEDSFTRLPLYFYNLELNNPGTQTRIVVGNDGRFVSCFCALGCSIVTFRSGLLRKVIIIDGAHLKGRYSGTMFLAIAMDGNNQVVPIAIGVAKFESGEHWTWLLSMLRECIGEMEGLVFMSDRAAAIHQAINTVYPNAHNALCCRHLFMNIQAKAPIIDDNKTLFWKTCKANTAHEFEFQMNALIAAVPYAEMLNRIGANKWSRAHFPGQRYNIMSSNSVESMNAHATVARKHPIVGLMDYFRSYQQQWYSSRRRIAGAMNNKLTQWAELIVQRRMGKCSGWTAHEIGYGKWEVQDGYRDAKVHIYDKTCTCKKWQLSGLPCGHVITVASYMGLDDCWQFASPYFTLHNLRETYAPTINPVGPLQTWVSPDYPLMVVHPPVMKKLPGKPSSNYRIPSRGETRTRKRCGICRQYGHKRSQCIHVPSATRQTPAEPTQQPNESFSHPTFDLKC
ncbi:hypothetical protein OSB04_007011 [Centaurea solstitialis]|uniref:SWIM-type domain-containing protein n=1 Tax=Centaurea solstitialis TaxID=347529 RepID=A0AA38TUK7_9ASTR|nr:hypothetical protein OSB04_007011 [Centaurea solstitialis]